MCINLHVGSTTHPHTENLCLCPYFLLTHLGERGEARAQGATKYCISHTHTHTHLWALSIPVSLSLSHKGELGEAGPQGASLHAHLYILREKKREKQSLSHCLPRSHAHGELGEGRAQGAPLHSYLHVARAHTHTHTHTHTHA